jgi:hypothetical protein
MPQRARDLRVVLAAWLQRHVWIGWVGWGLFLMVTLARTHPRRFASTFTYYLEAAQRLRAGGQIYDPAKLGDFLYFPATLLIYVPFTLIDRTAAARIATMLGAAFLSAACVWLTRALAPPERPVLESVALAGFPLLISIPAAWFNLKGVQAQVPMTAAMMAAGAAMAGGRWVGASLWLFVAIAMKPLAIVMLLLCAALVREMRWLLLAALVALLLLPFGVLDWSYLLAQHQALGLKLWHIATAPLEEWPYQADLSTMLRALGVPLPPAVSLPLRLAAALATLALAWHARRDSGRGGFALAVLLLSGCYITLFGPRNEFLSFIVLTPALGVLAGLVLGRDARDLRGWLLVGAALLLGFSFGLKVDAVLKPALVLAIYLWLAAGMLQRGRWRALVDAEVPPAASTDRAVAGRTAVHD